MTTNDVMNEISVFKKEQEEMRANMERIEKKLDMLLSILEGKDVSKVVTKPATSSATKPATSTKQKEKVQETIASYLHGIGMPAHLDGYKFISRSLELLMDDPSLIKNVTKILYVQIAKEFNIASSGSKPERAPNRVERSIRTAIEITWQRGDKQFINKIFGNSIKPNSGKPTNLEFIAMIAERIRMDL